MTTMKRGHLSDNEYKTRLGLFIHAMNKNITPMCDCKHFLCLTGDEEGGVLTALIML